MTVLLGKVVESSPALSLLDGLELLQDFALLVSAAFHDFPECFKLFELNLTVVVDINAVKELSSRHFAESSLPVLDGFILINSVRAVNVEESEDLLDSLESFGSEGLT